MATMPGELMTRHRLTVDDYHQMAESGILGPDDRVELISGEVLDMSPIGSLHAALVRALARWLADSNCSKAIVAVQDPICLDDASEPQPDIALLTPRADYYAAAHPGPSDTLLIVEVAESSLAYDLGVKVPLYARHGIPEVWVIDAATRTTHCFRQPGPEGYADCSEIPADGPLTCSALQGEPTSLATLLPLTPLTPPPRCLPNATVQAGLTQPIRRRSTTPQPTKLPTAARAIAEGSGTAATLSRRIVFVEVPKLTLFPV